MSGLVTTRRVEDPEQASLTLPHRNKDGSRSKSSQSRLQKRRCAPGVCAFVCVCAWGGLCALPSQQ